MADPGMHLTVGVDEDGLARSEVPHQAEPQGVDGDRLAGHTVIQFRAGPARPDDDRPDAVRIPEPDEADAVDEVDARVPALAHPHHLLHRREDLPRHVPGFHAPAVRQTVREDVEQQLRVGIGVGVPPEVHDALLVELLRVGEVAVVRDTDAVGVVRVQRLGLGARRGAGRRVADVADADVAAELEHVVLLEDILHEAVLLAQVEPAAAPPGTATVLLARHHARRVLSAVLEDGQAVEQHLIHVRIIVGENDPEGSAHGCLFLGVVAVDPF
mmetsp:Transcript_16724/g.33302  ORF Transcript_16724/g.33302 Transcript_16724/m.33302 type:complete len:271 (+) Transcript_16724:987-1799(+)